MGRHTIKKSLASLRGFYRLDPVEADPRHCGKSALSYCCRGREALAGLPKGVVGRTFRENGEEWRLLVNTSCDPVDSLRLRPLDVSMEPVKTGRAPISHAPALPRQEQKDGLTI